MELKKILSSRRSTRKFSDREVEKAKLQNIVDMALSAPSSRNTRSTRLWIVTDKGQLQTISEMRDYGAAFVKNAPVAILVMGDKEKSDLWLDNCAITATILQMAVVDEGLASCWVHVNDRPVKKDEPEGEKADDYLRRELQIPSRYGILCAVALGYSDFQPAPLPEYEGEERVKWL
jgi:nitroreductase